jgi:Protein of unknown function (DUF2695)
MPSWTGTNGGGARSRRGATARCCLAGRSMSGGGAGHRGTPASKSDIEVITIESPRWQEFCVRLARATDPSRCQHDHREAEKIMREMGGIDVEASIDYFENNGGYCDCEILLNVDHEWLWMDAIVH